VKKLTAAEARRALAAGGAARASSGERCLDDFNPVTCFFTILSLVTVFTL